MHKILFVEDEENYRTVIRTMLVVNNFAVLEAETGKEALIKLKDKPDAVLLDLILPDMHGFEVLKKINGHTDIPVIIISGKDNKSDFDTAFELGADDYIIKTKFDEPLLISKLENILRKKGQENITYNFYKRRISIDFQKKVVKVNNKEVHLSEYEYRLLELFAKNPGKVLDNEFILKEIWGIHCDNYYYVKVLIKKLRKKIEVEISNPKILISEYSRGYRLKI